MCYEGESEAEFFAALSSSRRSGAPPVEAMRKGRIVHGASLPWFLIFCKRLLSEGGISVCQTALSKIIKLSRITLLVG
jgi:hypothetical protein